MTRHNYLLLFVVLCTAALSTSTSTSTSSAVVLVDTQNGQVKGVTDRTLSGKPFHAFHAIPFAEPPVGERRFKDPSPVAPWEGTYDVTAPGALCAQIPILMTFSVDVVGAEDCLTLSVYTPRVDGPALPVMIYIHGGGFVMGGSSDSNAYSILDAANVVLVAVQYRLEAFGFLSTEDESAPGNLALKDQIMALEWVQQNIARFGGDPDTVTIFGESAGSVFVHYHLLMEQSRGLFHRAILQSGSVNCHWASTTNPGGTAAAIAHVFGCPNATSEKLVRCLQQIPYDRFAGANAIFGKNGVIPLKTVPYVDGSYIREDPHLLMQKGRLDPGIEVIIGVNRNEGAMETSLLFSTEVQLQQLQTNFLETAALLLGIAPTPESQAIVQRVYKRYLGDDFDITDSADGFVNLLGERAFQLPIDNSALALIRTGGGQVYAYEFEYNGQHKFADHFPKHLMKDKSVSDKWVGHADDLAYLFPGGSYFPRQHTDEDDKEMTRIMTKLWTNFAIYGDPTPDDSLGFKWEPATETGFRRLAIRKHSQMEDYKREQSRQFWESLPLHENLLTNPYNFKDNNSDVTQKKRQQDEL